MRQYQIFIFSIFISLTGCKKESEHKLDLSVTQLDLGQSLIDTSQTPQISISVRQGLVRTNIGSTIKVEIDAYVQNLTEEKVFSEVKDNAKIYLREKQTELLNFDFASTPLVAGKITFTLTIKKVDLTKDYIFALENSKLFIPSTQIKTLLRPRSGPCVANIIFGTTLKPSEEINMLTVVFSEDIDMTKFASNISITNALDGKSLSFTTKTDSSSLFFTSPFKKGEEIRIHINPDVGTKGLLDGKCNEKLGTPFDETIIPTNYSLSETSGQWYPALDI